MTKAYFRVYYRKYYKEHPEQYRRTKLKHLYGMSPEEYDRLLANQQGLCAICGTKPKKFNLDHDHHTKFVRGLLCHACNCVLGYAKDNPNILRRSADYLEHSILLDTL